MQTNEILSASEIKDLEMILNLKYSLQKKERKFSIGLNKEKQHIYVTVNLKNQDESFYYPVEACAKDDSSTDKTSKELALGILDYIDCYFEEFFASQETTYLNIDWAEHSFAGESFYLRAQINNRKCEKIADELLAKASKGGEIYKQETL